MISAHLRGAAGDLVTLPTRPPAAITGWSTRTPSLEPLSIFTLEYQTVGERAITRAARAACPREAVAPPEVHQLPRAGSASRSAVCGAASSRAQPLDLAFSSLFSPFASKVSPTHPNEVARRLQRAAGAALDRRERLLGAALERVEQAAARLAEVGGEQGDG